MFQKRNFYLGMTEQKGMRKASAKRTIVPVTAPPNVVLTPLAEFTAVLPKDAATGIE